MIQEGPLFHKPGSFLTARKLLYAIVFLSMIGFLLCAINPGFKTINGTYAIAAAIVLVLLFLIHEMSHCKKWARTVFLTFNILGILSYFFVFTSPFHLTFAEGALLVIQVALQIIALGFLYAKDSNEWFNNTASEILP